MPDYLVRFLGVKGVRRKITVFAEDAAEAERIARSRANGDSDRSVDVCRLILDWNEDKTRNQCPRYH